MATEFAQSAPVSALVWWFIPLIALLGAIGYVVWVAKFQERYRNQTQKSVGNFKKFQDSFREEEMRSPTQSKEGDER